MTDHITDEFPEFSVLKTEANRADRDRVIEAVMLRIQPTAPTRDLDVLISAIATTAWPVIGISGIAAMALLVLALLPDAATQTPPKAPAPSTAQALGIPAGVVRWTDQRERTPQLLEVVRDLPSRTP